MNLSDTQLAMLEQLCYMNNKVGEAAGLEGYEGINASHENQSIGEILEDFDVAELRKNGNKIIAGFGGPMASRNEMANIIEYIRSDEALSSLHLVDSYQGEDDVSLGLCFADPANPGQAVVAFKGTTGGNEWNENATAAAYSDMDTQIEALSFVQGLPYSDITAIGHSKGGNKAMYVTILSDKVTDCVSFDGQGFSPEFIEKYEEEILLRANKITNYAVAEDYVSALLFRIPGSEMIHVNGYGEVCGDGKLDATQYHSPTSFFKLDKNGNFELNADGTPVFENTEKAPAMNILSNFTYFLLNTASPQERQRLFGYIGNLLEGTLGKGISNIKKEDVQNLLFSDLNCLGLLMAHLVNYIATQNISADEIDSLLAVFGMDSLDELIKDVKLIGFLGTNRTLALLYLYERGNIELLNDLVGLLKYSKDPLMNNLGFALEYSQPYYDEISKREIDRESSVIPPQIQSDGSIDSNASVSETSGQNTSILGGMIRDFRKSEGSGYQVMCSAINNIQSTQSANFADLQSYQGEEWYETLGISFFIASIKRNLEDVCDINQACKSRMEQVYRNVYQIDGDYARKMKTVTEKKTRNNQILKTRADAGSMIY